MERLTAKQRTTRAGESDRPRVMYLAYFPKKNGQIAYLQARDRSQDHLWNTHQVGDDPSTLPDDAYRITNPGSAYSWASKEALYYGVQKMGMLPCMIQEMYY